MQIKINDDKKEVKLHGTYEFPLAVNYEELSKYDRGSFIWHWHPEVEFTLILKGEIEYRVNNKVYYLSEGEGLFGNVNTLHMGHMHNENECIYVSITFNPRIIYGYENSIMKSKYTDKIFNNNNLSSIHLTREYDWQKEILENLKSIYELYLEKHDTYEIKIQILLLNILLNIYTNNKIEFNNSLEFNIKNIDRLKTIVTYIHENYNKKITLDDIASEISMCKSECCSFFKRHMNQSLFEYLLNYRIEKSLNLLSENKFNITEISEIVGFSSSAYFTKIFRRKMLCSPREYKSRKEY